MFECQNRKRVKERGSISRLNNGIRDILKASYRKQGLKKVAAFFGRGPSHLSWCVHQTLSSRGFNSIMVDGEADFAISKLALGKLKRGKYVV